MSESQKSVSQDEKQREDLYHKTRFASLELATGDTFVFIDFPEPKDASRIDRDCYLYPFPSQIFRVRSASLLATESSKFAEMLSPTYQFRVKRRRGVTKSLPSDIKYVLDLTPPSEGDDLVFQMMELSLSKGIRDWWMASRLHQAPEVLVKGHDDVCSCIPLVNDKKGFSGDLAPRVIQGTQTGDRELFDIPVSVRQLALMNAHGISQPYSIPEWYNIQEYCPIRHRNSIIRLMLAIHGQKITLHSAAAMWSLLGVAKIFECVPAVSSLISSWVCAKNNQAFIETFPEEAIKIGFATQDKRITEAAYSILVNELALELADTFFPRRDYTHRTVFGRKKGDAGDEINNLVQHGARALIERVTMYHHMLTNEDILDSWTVPEWGRMCDIEQTLTGTKTIKAKTALRLLQDAKKSIRDEAREALTLVIDQPHHGSEYFAAIDSDRSFYVAAADFEPASEIIARLNTTQHFLMPYIYYDLEQALHKDTLLRCARERFAPGAKYPFGAIKLYSAVDAAIMEIDEEERDWLRITKPPFEEWLSVERLYSQMQDFIKPVASTWMREGLVAQLNLTRHLLLTMSINETKYLPLWADGSNDGTGGVFENEIPHAHMGPSGPGPAFHTGLTEASDASSVGSSFVDEMDGLDMRGTDTLRSVNVNDGISTVYRSDQVIADDVSIPPSDPDVIEPSDSFSSFGDEEDFEDARKAIPLDDDMNNEEEGFLSDVDTASTITEGVFSHTEDE